jgi:hypothetical protein
MKKSELKEIIKECVREVLVERRKLADPIIPDALKLIKNAHNVVKYTSKSKFDKDLKNRNTFSGSYSHAYYSKEDMKAAHSGDPKWKKGTTGISETDRGAVIMKDSGDLAAVWSPKDKVGYIVPARTNEASGDTEKPEVVKVFNYIGGEDIHRFPEIKKFVEKNLKLKSGRHRISKQVARVFVRNAGEKNALKILDKVLKNLKDKTARP